MYHTGLICQQVTDTGRKVFLDETLRCIGMNNMEPRLFTTNFIQLRCTSPENPGGTGQNPG